MWFTLETTVFRAELPGLLYTEGLSSSWIHKYTLVSYYSDSINLWDLFFVNKQAVWCQHSLLSNVKKIFISLYTLTVLLLNALRHQPLNFYLLPLKRLLFIYEQLHISHSIRINIESCPSSKFAGRKMCALSSVNGSWFVQRNICENCFFCLHKLHEEVKAHIHCKFP